MGIYYQFLEEEIEPHWFELNLADMKASILQYSKLPLANQQQ